MRSRSARFDKLLQLRERELELRKGDLARANDLLRRAEQVTAESQERLRQAARLHRGDGSARSAEELRESSDWLRDRVTALEQCLLEEQRARQNVDKTRVVVQHAEREKRKIELLIERILQEESVEKTREEQRQTDELASLKTAHRGRLA